MKMGGCNNDDSDNEDDNCPADLIADFEADMSNYPFFNCDSYEYCWTITNID